MTTEHPLMGERVCVTCEHGSRDGAVCGLQMRLVCAQVWHAGAAHEREECAKIPEFRKSLQGATAVRESLQQTADAIRARAKK